jgi:hypothetical protein
LRLQFRYEGCNVKRVGVVCRVAMCIVLWSLSEESNGAGDVRFVLPRKKGRPFTFCLTANTQAHIERNFRLQVGSVTESVTLNNLNLVSVRCVRREHASGQV